ncbi:MAG: hypothetical protein VR70_10720 [Rhodospirillaceae bacterium BRH_c57]|nr:MAG: hypothetical protein VR70_10720 [Rhodospirillaceae bacterium BRH_c57]
MFIMSLILAGAATVSGLAAKPLADLAGMPTEAGLAVVFVGTVVVAFAVNFAFGAIKSLAMLAVLAVGIGLGGWKMGYLPDPSQWLSSATQYASGSSSPNFDYGTRDEKSSWTNPARTSGIQDFGSGHYAR